MEEVSNTLHCNLEAEEKKVGPSQVKNVDREGIPAHAKAKKPQHNHISCQPNQGNYEVKQMEIKNHHGTG
jgi:hypothetical protein